MKKVPNFKSYLTNKTFIGYGLVNGIINAGIFYMMEKGHMDATFDLAKIIEDMAITSFFLGALLAAIVIPLTIKELHDNKFSVSAQDKMSPIVSMLPQTKLKASMAIGLITMTIVTAVSAIAGVMIHSMLPLTVMQMLVFKGIGCAIGGAVAGNLVVQIAVFVFANNTTKADKKAA